MAYACCLFDGIPLGFHLLALYFLLHTTQKMIGFFHRSRLVWRCFRRWFYHLRRGLPLLVFFPFFVFADGNIGNCSLCCGWVEENNGQYDIYQPGNSCVRMSSAQCSEVRDGLEDSIDAIDEQVNYIVETWSATFRQTFSDALQNINMQIVGTIHVINEAQQNISDASGNLNTAVRSLQSAINYNNESISLYSSIGSGSVFITNITTGANSLFPRSRSPYYRCNFLTNYLYSASAAVQLASFTNQVVASKVQTILSSLNTIQQDVSSLSSVVDTQINQLETNLNSIYSATQSSRQYLASMNCDSCGQNTAGGGTAGGGSTTLIDLTPVVNAINAHREEMVSRINDLKQLINNLYTDYNNARLIRLPNSQPTYSTYNLGGDNWFKRVESLLFAVAYPNLQSDVISDYNPDEKTEVKKLMDDNEQNSLTASNDVAAASVDVNGSVWYRLKHDVETLYQSFDFLRVSTASVAGGFGDSGIRIGDFNVDPLHVDSDVSSILDNILRVVRYASTALYYVFGALALLGFFVILFNAVKKCVEFQLQLYSSLFGSS